MSLKSDMYHYVATCTTNIFLFTFRIHATQMHGVTFLSRDALLCGVQNFALQLCECRITGTLQLTTSQEYVPGIINMSYKNQKHLNSPQSLNYLWWMCGIPTKEEKEKSPHLLFTSILLFASSTNTRSDLLAPVMYGHLLFPFSEHWLLF